LEKHIKKDQKTKHHEKKKKSKEKKKTGQKKKRITLSGKKEEMGLHPLSLLQPG
jgi:hypothetical protein